MKAIQLRMARAAVGWGVRDLARKARVAANTVSRIENGADAKQSTMDRLQNVLEEAGVEFTNGDQPGVRVSKAVATSGMIGSRGKIGQADSSAKTAKIGRSRRK